MVTKATMHAFNYHKNTAALAWTYRSYQVYLLLGSSADWPEDYERVRATECSSGIDYTLIRLILKTHKNIDYQQSYS